MSQPTDLARQLIGAFNALDADALLPILHADAEHIHFETRTRGRDNIVGRFKTGVFPRFQRITFTPVAVYEDRDQATAIVEWRSSVVPARGSAYANSGVFIVKTEDGLIRALIEYFDTDKVRRNVQ